MSSKVYQKVNATLRQYQQHLLGSTAAARPDRRTVTHHQVLDSVIINPERAFETYFPDLVAGTLSACAATTIFEHLVRAPVQ